MKFQLASHESNINRVSPTIVLRSLLAPFNHHNVDLSYVNKFVICDCNSHTIVIERGIQTSDIRIYTSLGKGAEKTYGTVLKLYLQ